jgi:2-keto-4-pentenoate hydratase
VAIDGSEAYQGNSARILGNPLLAVVALANAQPLPLGGLKKGQIITTGSCVTPVPLRDGTYVADLGPLGTVRLTVTG